MDGGEDLFSCRAFRGLYRVGHQHGDGHRADAAGNRRDPARDFFGRIKIHITAQFAVFHTVDSHVYHCGAGFDHVTGNHLGFAGGDHEDVGIARELGEIDGLGGADGDGRVVLQQQ